MAYKKDYKTRLKDPTARPEPPKPVEPPTARAPAPVVKAPPAVAPPSIAESETQRLMFAPTEVSDQDAFYFSADPVEGSEVPPDPEDLISHLPLERYQASGRYSVGGAVVALVVGTLFASLFGALYGWATARLSVSLLSMPICMLYAFVASIVIYLAMQAGKLRSDGAIFVTAFISALAAWAASWVAFNVSMFNRGLAPYHPDTIDGILGNVLAISSAGRGLFGNWVVYGQGLTMASWIVEGLFMVLFPPFLNVSIVASTPFCEDCGKWVDTESYHFRTGPAQDLEEFRRDFIARGPAALEALGQPALDDYIEVKVHVCTLCQKIGFVNLQHLKKLGVNPRPTATTIDNNLAVKGMELRRMQELADRARASGQDVDPGK